jgi:signal transduction histidine kinase
MVMSAGSRFFSTLGIMLVIIMLVAGCTQSDATRQRAVSPSPSPSLTPVSTGIPAETTETDLIAFVHEAVKYAKDNGRQNALAVYSDPNGSFVRGELYIYAYDYDGLTLAHPFNPEKIGENRLNETDALGTFFIRNLRDAAKNGTGFVDFAYINPAHNRTVEQKLGYVSDVDGTWWLGSGIYNGTVQTM